MGVGMTFVIIAGIILSSVGFEIGNRGGARRECSFCVVGTEGLRTDCCLSFCGEDGGRVTGVEKEVGAEGRRRGSLSES